MNSTEPEKNTDSTADQQLAEGKFRTAISPDTRHISHGREIPSHQYADQPYIVKTDDGAWLCVMTTGAGKEGQAGQHVVSLRSSDGGQTWEEPVPIESPDGPEASWAVALKIPSGRIYAFYVHNTDNIRQLKADNPPYSSGYTQRMDSFGYYVFKYSDDHGRSWSSQRYTIPVRPFEIDRNNVYQGEIRFFWNVGKPFMHDNAAFVPIHKVGGLGDGWFTSSEGALLKSEDLLDQKDPAKITWQTLPDGEIGLRTPPGGGPVAEEQSFSVLSDGTFYCVYRTIDGYSACTYSDDGGHTWTEPQYKTYPDGRRLKNPRAANFAWRCANGKFLYWFHNHGGRQIVEHPQRRTASYQDRNPVWLSAGVEVDTPQGKRLHWSQPEIALYDDDPYVRMSYPDLIEADGKIYLSETQKFIARSHEIDAELLDGMWASFTAKEKTTAGLALELEDAVGLRPRSVPAPRLPLFNERDNQSHNYGGRDLRQGFSIEISFTLATLAAGQILLDNRGDDRKGFCLRTTDSSIEIVLNDGRTQNSWDCDGGILQTGHKHRLAVVVDGGPKIISFVVDGLLCDGGQQRQYGWSRFSPHLREANGGETLRIAERVAGTVHGLMIYTRALRTFELVGNYRAANS
jgi:hypothetical protein